MRVKFMFGDDTDDKIFPWWEGNPVPCTGEYVSFEAGKTYLVQRVAHVFERGEWSIVIYLRLDK